MLSNQHYPYRANQKQRSWANAVFLNRGVCGQAVPSFPSPSPIIPFFFFSLFSQLSRRTSRGNACYAGYQNSPLPTPLVLTPGPDPTVRAVPGLFSCTDQDGKPPTFLGTGLAYINSTVVLDWQKYYSLDEEVKKPGLLILR